MKDFYTIQEAANLLGKSPQTVRRMIKRGDLNAQRIKTPQGFHYVVRRDAIGTPKSSSTEENVQNSMANEPTPKPPIQMLPNSPIQNVDTPQEEAENRVLTNQTQILTSQSEVEVHKQADLEGIDKNHSTASAEEKAERMIRESNELHHREKLGLFNIIDSLQSQLEAERRKPRSLMAYLMEWLTS